MIGGRKIPFFQLLKKFRNLLIGIHTYIHIFALIFCNLFWSFVIFDVIDLIDCCYCGCDWGFMMIVIVKDGIDVSNVGSCGEEKLEYVESWWNKEGLANCAWDYQVAGMRFMALSIFIACWVVYVFLCCFVDLSWLLVMRFEFSSV